MVSEVVNEDSEKGVEPLDLLGSWWSSGLGWLWIWACDLGMRAFLA